MHLDPRLLQGAVGHIVPRVDHHLPRADGQGVAAVVPLLPGRVYLAAPAALDQRHVVQAQVLLQNVLQTAVLLGDLHLLVLVQLHHEHRDAGENVGVHRELVPVHHGEHRVQVHEGPALGNVEGQDLLELRSGIGQDGLRQSVDGVPLRPLGNAHRQDLRA